MTANMATATIVKTEPRRKLSDPLHEGLFTWVPGPVRRCRSSSDRLLARSGSCQMVSRRRPSSSSSASADSAKTAAVLLASPLSFKLTDAPLFTAVKATSNKVQASLSPFQVQLESPLPTATTLVSAGSAPDPQTLPLVAKSGSANAFIWASWILPPILAMSRTLGKMERPLAHTGLTPGGIIPAISLIMAPTIILPAAPSTAVIVVVIRKKKLSARLHQCQEHSARFFFVAWARPSPRTCRRRAYGPRPSSSVTTCSRTGWWAELVSANMSVPAGSKVSIAKTGL